MAKSYEFGGFGTPYFEPPVGMAQEALQSAVEVPEVPMVVEYDDRYEVTVTLPAANLEGHVVMTGEGKKDDGKTSEQALFGAYQDVFPTLKRVKSIYNTGFIPPEFGVDELGCETEDGEFFNSVADTTKEAVRDAVAYVLFKQQ